MKTKIIGLTLAFCFLAGPLCLAADPLIGTWKLNEAKSKFTPGTGKNTRVVYETRASQVRITADGVNATGKLITVHLSNGNTTDNMWIFH